MGAKIDRSFLEKIADPEVLAAEDAALAQRQRQHAAKQLYERIKLQGNTLTLTDVEVGYIARLLDEAQ